MKNIVIPFLFYFSLPAFSQTTTNPLKIKYNANWEVISSGTPFYVAKAWEEDGKWHKQDFYYTDEKLQMDGYYTDDEFKTKDGQFTWYFQNGQVSISSQFSNNKKEGIENTT